MTLGPMYIPYWYLEPLGEVVLAEVEGPVGVTQGSQHPIPKAPSTFIVSTRALTGSLYPNFGLSVWTVMVLGAFGNVI